MTFDGTCGRGGGVQRAPQEIEERSPDVRPAGAKSKKGWATRLGLRGVSAVEPPLVQLSHAVWPRGAGSGAALNVKTQAPALAQLC